MNMNNNEFNSFLFSQIIKAMDHFRIQKPRLYAIRYWKFHEVFHIHSFHTGRERERETCLVFLWERTEKKGCLVWRKMSTEAFGMNEVEKEMNLNQLWFIDFKSFTGALIKAFFSFSFLFLFQIPPPSL